MDINFIGDLSKEDARLLKKYVINANNILEFGCGGSTQIISQFCKTNFTSIDTKKVWIDKTLNNIQLFNIKQCVNFKLYNEFNFKKDCQYDLIFNDGAIDKRLEFALNIWDSLIYGGYLLIHDSKTVKVCNILKTILSEKLLEISSIQLNVDNSNISVITKQKRNEYKNWNVIENKPEWLYSPLNADIPDNFIEIMNKL